MKKQIVLGLALAVSAAPAFATKARMLALGENINENIGSLYFSDSRNMFQNAAYINMYKNMVITEWGGSAVGTAGTGSAKKDTDNNPQAEGGVTYGHGKYAYGLYLGAESPYTNEIRTYTRSIQNSSFNQDNQIDAFFGGDEGELKWGTNVTYSNSKDSSQGARQTSTSVRFGFIKNKLEGFANIALQNQARMQSRTGAGGTTLIDGTDKFQGKRGFELGATYDLSAVKVFGYVRHAAWEHNAMSTAANNITAYTGKFDGTYWLYQLGAGKEHKMTDKTTVFTKLEALAFYRNVKGTSGALNGKKVDLDDMRIPLTIGLEHDAASWLTVRGSIVQNIWSKVDNNYHGNDGSIAPAIVTTVRQNGKGTANNSTNVNAGATLKFGDLSVDGVVGTNNNGTTTDTAGEKGILSLDNLMTRVAMTYKF